MAFVAAACTHEMTPIRTRHEICSTAPGGREGVACAWRRQRSDHGLKAPEQFLRLLSQGQAHQRLAVEAEGEVQVRHDQPQGPQDLVSLLCFEAGACGTRSLHRSALGECVDQSIHGYARLYITQGPTPRVAWQAQARRLTCVLRLVRATVTLYPRTNATAGGSCVLRLVRASA